MGSSESSGNHNVEDSVDIQNVMCVDVRESLGVVDPKSGQIIFDHSPIKYVEVSNDCG